MPSFKVSHECKLSANEAYDRVRDVIESNDSFRSIDPNYVVKFDDNDMSGKANSKMFKARFKVDEKSRGSKVSFTIDLPLKYALAKTLVVRSLTEKMREELA